MPYPPDPALRTLTIDLLGGIWKKLPAGVAQARAWGADWFEVSTPFVHRVAEVAAAHVGVIDLPLVLDGRRRRVAGIHAVGTHADHRGRGYFRQTLERALAWVDAHYDAAVLWANDPSIYTRFGFVARAESIFLGSVRGAATPAQQRRLSLEREDDVALLRSRLIARTPVSTRCGAGEAESLALIDLALWPAPGPVLALLPDLDCVVVFETKGRVLQLYDVIAPRMPALAELTAALGPGLERVEVYFSPEGLAAPELEAAPTSLPDFLMVRGTLLTGPEPFALSPLARC